MNKPAIKLAVDAILDLPEADRREAIAILNEITQSNDSSFRLSPTQIEEVRAILADPNPEDIDHDQVFAELEKMLDGR